MEEGAPVDVGRLAAQYGLCGGMAANVAESVFPLAVEIMGHRNNSLRHLGMIQTSGSHRRHWLNWRWLKYPMAKSDTTKIPVTPTAPG